MALYAKVPGNLAGGLDFAAVTLVVVDRQGVDRKAPLARDGGDDHRIEPAGKKDDGFADRVGHGAPLGT